MPDLVRVRRALISVSDKSNLDTLARSLNELGVEIISTGGSATIIRELGIDVVDVSEVTGFPEILDGRVKTLHPSIHGAILGRTEIEAHAETMAEHGITPIDLVCVNLYPFDTQVTPDTTHEQAVELIDIGGPGMIRAAAKNAERVTVVCDPASYPELLEELRSNDGSTSAGFRRRLMARAFARTAAYDAAIASHLAAELDQDPDDASPEMPVLRVSRADRSRTLRYGENPHQSAAVYITPDAAGASIAGADPLSGKALSYNNLLDADAAARTVMLMHAGAAGDRFAACVVKHTNPCGAAITGTLPGAIDAAFAGDPVAAFGGIVAVSAPIDADAADAIARDGRFVEVVIAPSFEPAAIERLTAKWKNVRLLPCPGLDSTPSGHDLIEREILGGKLVQSADSAPVNAGNWMHAAGPAPSTEQINAAVMLDTIAARVLSNAVVIGGVLEGDGVGTFGVGGGQVDRVTACRIAVEKAGERARGAIVASDAFFPFSDGPEILADAGVSMIVHPGGSKRDQDTFDLCDERGITCMTTGRRRFRH